MIRSQSDKHRPIAGCTTPETESKLLLVFFRCFTK